ncbi:MAG TPA: trypsin-like peptidase domain-containing protein [Candidatus Acidoferrum sp.]|nr:trypsin-like peptidase domain-containing protein [Candidatus Acidoferrum sp.]
MHAKLNMKTCAKLPLGALGVLCFLLPAFTEPAPAPRKAAADPSVTAALCQVVYPLDQSPEEGYRYMFLGNGFFVNNQGYVVTAAHLLSSFRYGGEPYILVGPPQGPARMLEAPIVAADWDHDVAVLRAKPNPFQNDKNIGFLALSADTLAPGADVVSESLIPPDEKDAHTSAPPREDFSQGEVIDYQFYRDRGDSEQQLLLFDRDVVPGQSGSPLVSTGTHAVVGVVVGRWLHPTVAPSGPESGHVTVSPGAALRIHYAIGLLEQSHVQWDMASKPPEVAAAPQQADGSTVPVPLSLVGVPYPPQALFGGEVTLDAEVGTGGKLDDIRVVSGAAPFLDVALGAAKTWTFVPARTDGQVVSSRIGIVFQFAQSFLPRVTPNLDQPTGPLPNVANSSALPVTTVQPDYPPNSLAEGSVILYGLVDAQGQLTSLSALHSVPSLTTSAEDAVRQWRFASGLRDGAPAESAVVVVTTFRRVTGHLSREP